MKLNKLLLALAASGIATSAFATNGMNVEGYGPIAAAMGGASMAYDNGSAAVMNNPATLGLMAKGSQFDVAVGMLGPDVKSTFMGTTNTSGGDAYYMPAVGYIKNDGNKSYGVAMFAQGGMGTEYPKGGTLDPSMGSLDQRSELGVGRLIFPLAMNINDKLTIGGSADVVWAMMDLQMALNSNQFFDLMGVPGTGGGIGSGHTFGTASGSMLTTFTGLSGTVLNNGTGTGAGAGTGPLNWGYFNFSDTNDYTGKAKATGLAGKIGFTYKASPQLTIGSTYHSKTSLSDMEGDAILAFNVNADLGYFSQTPAPTGTYTATTMPVSGKIKVVDFQWPETFGLGMAFQVNDRLMVAVDYKRINWADVMKNFKMTFTADNVAGNGAFSGTVMDATLYQNWDDQNVFQVGGAYKATDALTVRAGASFSKNPIPDAYMNPLFPAIEKNHYTMGVGYAIDKASDLNFSLQHAPNVTQTTGSGVSVDHSQTSWQLMYSKRF